MRAMFLTLGLLVVAGCTPSATSLERSAAARPTLPLFEPSVRPPVLGSGECDRPLAERNPRCNFAPR